MSEELAGAGMGEREDSSTRVEFVSLRERVSLRVREK
jgi:hypothetical protein